jgi:hypothetical protein
VKLNSRLTVQIALATAAFAFCGGSTARAFDDPVLVGATFHSHTNNEDKDHDTGVYVRVSSSDGSGIIAHADNRDNSGDDGTQYKDNSDHEFGLDIDARAIRKSACRGFLVHLWIHTHGNDTWRMSGWVRLDFSDGSNLVANLGNSELKNDGASVDFSSPQ